MGLGGGIFGGQGYTTFSPETINDDSREVHAQAIRELVARDKNHPSVVLWSHRQRAGVRHRRVAEDYFRPLFDVAREPTPPDRSGFVNVMLAPHGHVPGQSQFADVLMLNRYYGWYVNTGDLAGAEHRLDRGAARAGPPRASRSSSPSTAPTPSPASTRGHAAAVERGVPGRLPRHEPPRLRHRRRRRRRARLELRRLRHHQSGIMRVDGNKKGAFTRDRRPKSAAFALRRRWTSMG